MTDIRKISVGPDYKNNAMHYIVGQKVLNDAYIINHIKFDKSTDSIKIYIINDKQEVLLWKEFNSSIPTSIEFNINY